VKVSILVQHAPHVAALTAQYHLTPNLRASAYLVVEALGQLR